MTMPKTSETIKPLLECAMMNLEYYDVVDFGFSLEYGIQEQIDFAKIPYTAKERQDYNNDENPDYCLDCTNEDGNKVMIGSDFYCLKCHVEENYDVHDCSVLDCERKLADHFNLTKQERLVEKKSGKERLFLHRIRWARTSLKKAGLIKDTRKGHFAITPLGLEEFESLPEIVTEKYLNKYASFKNSRRNRKFPDECDWDQVDDGRLGQVLLYVTDDPNQEDELENGICMVKAIEDPNERYQFTMKYAKEHNAEIYTEVDLDNGEVGYSRGVRFVNRINQGLYVVVKQVK